MGLRFCLSGLGVISSNIRIFLWHSFLSLFIILFFEFSFLFLVHWRIRIHPLCNVLLPYFVRRLIELTSGNHWIISTHLPASLKRCRRLSELWSRFWSFLICPSLIILLVSVCISFNIPWVVHHQSKVVIIVNRHRNISIVLSKFF